MRYLVKLMVTVVVFFVLLATPAVGSESLTVTDMAGRKVRVPKNPQRIVGIGPGSLRLIVYLQATNKVAGVEELEKINPEGRPYWLAQGEQLKDLPRIGPGGPNSINKKPDLEAILSVGPDIVFISYMEARLADTVQKQLGIPLVVISYGEFATFDTIIYDSLRMMGKILDKQKRAEAVVNYIESLRVDLDNRTRDIPAEKMPSAYVGGIGFRGSHGIESTEQNYIPMKWVRANNVAEQVDASVGSHVFMDKETLLMLNPAVIFIDGGGLSLVAQDYAKKPDYYKALAAFQNKQVYQLLPFNWYVTNIETAVADAYAIGKILYPQRFSDIDLKEKANAIYQFLVGAPVYEKMVKTYGALGARASFLRDSPENPPEQ